MVLLISNCINKFAQFMKLMRKIQAPSLQNLFRDLVVKSVCIYPCNLKWADVADKQSASGCVFVAFE